MSDNLTINAPVIAADESDPPVPEAVEAALHRWLAPHDGGGQDLGAADVIHLPLLPDVSYPEMAGAIQPIKPTKRPPRSKKRPISWRGLALSRQPTDLEAEILNLHDIVATFARETDHVVLSLTTDRHVMIDRARTLDTIAPQPPSQTAAMLRTAQLDMAAYGARQVRDELRRQGVWIPEPPSGDVRAGLATLDLLERSVVLTAEIVNQEWGATVRRHAHRALRTRRDTLKEDVLTSCAAHADWGLKGHVRRVLHEAFAAGRTEEARRLSALWRSPGHGGLVRGVIQAATNGEKGPYGKAPKGGTDAPIGRPAGAPLRPASDFPDQYPDEGIWDWHAQLRGDEFGPTTTPTVLNDEDDVQILANRGGYIALTPHEDETGRWLMVTGVGVRSDQRRQGYGLDLYRRAFHYAKQLGLDGVVTSVDGTSGLADHVWASLARQHTVKDGALIGLEPPPPRTRRLHHQSGGVIHAAAIGPDGKGPYGKVSGPDDPMVGESPGTHTPAAQRRVIAYLEQAVPGLRLKPHGSVGRGQTSPNDMDIAVVPMTPAEEHAALDAENARVAAVWDRHRRGEISEPDAMRAIYGDDPNDPTDALSRALAHIGFTPTTSAAWLGIETVRYENPKTGHTIEIWSKGHDDHYGLTAAPDAPAFALAALGPDGKGPYGKTPMGRGRDDRDDEPDPEAEVAAAQGDRPDAAALQQLLTDWTGAGKAARIAELLGPAPAFQAFHGTSAAALASIKRDGLLPEVSNQTGRVTTRAAGGHAHVEAEGYSSRVLRTGTPGRSTSVFVTSRRDLAQTYATWAAGQHPGSEAVVLEVTIPRDHLLYGLTPDALSAVSHHAWQYRGDIPPAWIKRVLPDGTRVDLRGEDDTRAYYVLLVDGAAPDPPTVHAADRIDLAKPPQWVAAEEDDDELIEYVMQSALLDANCCLCPGSSVLTPTGYRPIAAIRVSDRVVDGHGRPARVQAVTILPGHDAVRLRTAHATLAVTVDHPILIARGHTLQWAYAGSVRVGDRVLRDRPRQPRLEGRGPHAGFWNTQHAEPAGAGATALASIALAHRRQPVPVGAVDLDEQAPRTDVQVERIPPIPHAGWTLYRLAARPRADRVPIAIRAGDGERPPTVSAGLVNALPLIATGHGAVASDNATARGVGKGHPAASQRGMSAALPRLPNRAGSTAVCLSGREAAAIGARAANPRPDDGLSADLPNAPLIEIAAPAAAWPLARRPLPAIDAETAHLDDVWMEDIVVQVEPIPTPTVVYDLTISGDHLFFADGMLVHNCDPCAAIDGQVYRYGSAKQIRHEPPYYKCLGGDSCRCEQLFVVAASVWALTASEDA